MLAQRYETPYLKNASLHYLYFNLYHNFEVYTTNKDVHHNFSGNQNNKEKIKK